MSESPFVGAVLEGLQRQLAKPKVQKEPLSSDMLTALVESLGANPTLSDVRLVAACVLVYAAFLHYDELAKLRCCNVTFKDTHMEVHTTSSKTDQYRQGDSVVVARTGSATGPVALLERYYGMAAITRESRLKLFRGITATKSGERLRSQGGLSYTRLRELFLQKLTSLGFDAKQFGCIASGLEEQQQQRRPAYLTGFSNAMGNGVQSLLKMGISKTQCHPCCLSHRV